jgi:hypothetical protein
MIFYVMEKTIDAKTSIYVKDHFRVILGNYNSSIEYKLKSDIYVALDYIPETKTLIYLGGIDKENLIKRRLLRTDTNIETKYCYFERCHLKELNENLEYNDDFTINI